MIPEFRPARWLPGAHLQTIAPALLPARFPHGTTCPLLVPVGGANTVQLLVDEPAPQAEPRGTALIVHGLAGCAESPYVLRTAAALLADGWVTARMNCRNCGGTEALSRTLYNAGQFDDVGYALAALAGSGRPRPLAAIGFSLGGNLVLGHAGHSGSACTADAVISINPPLDLDACNRALEQPGNRLYHWRFVLLLCRHLKRIRRLRPVPGPPASWRVVDTVRSFDRLFTAPDAGYPSAEAYYAAASSGPCLPAVERPALVLSARDDPFVPAELFPPWHHRNPKIHFLHPDRGGHVGYWASSPPRYWAAEAARAFLDRLG